MTDKALWRSYGIVIAAGLGIAAVGLAALFLKRRTGLKSFYEEESVPTLH